MKAAVLVDPGNGPDMNDGVNPDTLASVENGPS